MEGHRPIPICVPFEMFADEIHWELFANLFCSIHEVCANISSQRDSTNPGPVHPTYAAAYNLCEGWILDPLARITIDPWMEELILAMKLLPDAGFLNMDNLYWEKFYKGGAGIFDLEYTNMLTTLTQFVNNFTRKQFENGIDKGYKILPLGKIQSNHYKVSFDGDSAFLTKHHGQYVHPQYTLCEFAYNQKKATQTNPYATYSSTLTSLGQGRRVGGFELVAQKTAKNRGDLYSSTQIVWGLEPYNMDDSMPGVGGALVLTKTFQSGSENDVLSKECMQFYTNQRYLQYRVFKGVVAFGQTPGGMGNADIGHIQLNTGLRYALFPSPQWP